MFLFAGPPRTCRRQEHRQCAPQPIDFETENMTLRRPNWFANDLAKLVLPDLLQHP
jgi:hypothetical protein